MHEDYNRMHILTQRDDIILEAKRVLLNEDIDKIINFTLTDHCETLAIKVNPKECKQEVAWNDTEFWDDLPNPKNKNNSKNTDGMISHLNHDNLSILNNISELKKQVKALIGTKYPKTNRLRMLRRYFNKWHLHVIKTKEKKILREINTERKEKLQLLLKNIAKYQNIQKKQIQQSEPYNEKMIGERINERNICIEQKQDSNLNPTTHTEQITVQINSPFKNRFKAQRKIIEAQKLKLTEQEKTIQELKLGIIKEDLMKSINNSKIDIQEIGKKCSTKVKCTIVPTVEFVENEREKFRIETQKAPRIVQQMEQRAIERALKREIILERKRVIEEEKKRLAEEAIEKKRIQDEEEKKRNLEIIKQRRIEDLKLEKMKQMNKQRFLEKFDRAAQYHTKATLRSCFNCLKQNLLRAKANVVKSQEHYVSKTLNGAFKQWYRIVEDKYNAKCSVADSFYDKKILKLVFILWKRAHQENVLSMQVAEDFYDLCLQTNIFVHWHRYVCTEITVTHKNIIRAENHYKRWIMFHYFYQWRSLPAVMQLEKAKEEKKRKWRAKVWEILPDYKPPDDELYL